MSDQHRLRLCLGGLAAPLELTLLSVLVPQVRLETLYSLEG